MNVLEDCDYVVCDEVRWKRNMPPHHKSGFLCKQVIHTDIVYNVTTNFLVPHMIFSNYRFLKSYLPPFKVHTNVFHLFLYGLLKIFITIFVVDA